MHEFFSITLALFLLMDSPGNVPLFISILKGFSEKDKRRIILRELIIALATIYLFYFVGDALLNLMQIKQYTLFIAGGLILFYIAFRMIFAPHRTQNDTQSLKEPLIVPLAIPLVAGPAVLAAVIIYAQQAKDPTLVISAIGVSWAVSTVILVSSSFLQKLIGDRGLAALEKIMGLLLALIAIQMLLQGVSLYTCELSSLAPR